MQMQRQSGLSVGLKALPQAILWGLFAHLVYNRWEDITQTNTESWGYGYSISGVIWWLLDKVVPEQWAPLTMVGIAIVVLVLLTFKFLPLIRATMANPITSALIVLVIFAVTIGLSETIYYGFHKTWFFSLNLFLNVVPPLLVTSLIMAGKAGRVQMAETGIRQVTDESDGLDLPQQG